LGHIRNAFSDGLRSGLVRERWAMAAVLPER
jgi:hypothetical protein